MPNPARVHFLYGLLQVQTPSRGSGHRGEKYTNAGDAYF